MHVKCPYCDDKMEQGVIQSPHEISWMKKKHIIGSAEFHKGSIILSELSF
ncbi:PF20097 family protein [Lachnoclostridium phytofermentans]